MVSILAIIQIICSILLIILILLQSEGSGLSSAFSLGGYYHTRRGFEKIIFYLTVIMAFLFCFTSLLNFITF